MEGTYYFWGVIILASRNKIKIVIMYRYHCAYIQINDAGENADKE